MGRSAANVLARRVARSGIQSQRAFSKTAVSEQAAGTGLGRPDAQVCDQRWLQSQTQTIWPGQRFRRPIDRIARPSASTVLDSCQISTIQRDCTLASQLVLRVLMYCAVGSEQQYAVGVPCVCRASLLYLYEVAQRLLWHVAMPHFAHRTSTLCACAAHLCLSLANAAFGTSSSLVHKKWDT